MKIDEWEDECDAHMLKAAGVYAVLDEDNEVLCIGETDCFIHRWGQYCAIGSGTPVPIGKISKFVVLEYEDNRIKRRAAEAEWYYRLKPPYGQIGYKATEINPIRRREYLRFLRLNNLPRPPTQTTWGLDPEGYDSTLEDELRHLKLDDND